MYRDSYLQGLRNPSLDSPDLVDDATTDPACPRTGQSLEAVYDLKRVTGEVDRDALFTRTGSQWDWFPLLPVRDPDCVVTLAEGSTPLIRAHRLGALIGVDQLYLKDESRNPTSTFKDRGASVTASKSREVGIDRWVLASSGNAAVAFSMYASASGIRFVGLIRRDTSAVNRLHAQISGQALFVVRGGMLEGTRLAADLASRFGIFHCTQPYNLYRVEGKKTQGFEIVAQLGWEAPHHVFLPTSGGTNALALQKALTELRVVGWLDTTPAIEVVQPSGCAPVVEAWRRGGSVGRWDQPRCSILGLGHPHPAAGDRVVEAMRVSGGRSWTVDDAECYLAQALLAKTEGLFVAPAAVAGLAALIQLGPDEARRRFEGRTVVLVLTGGGETQTDEPAAGLPGLPVIDPDVDSLIELCPELMAK